MHMISHVLPIKVIYVQLRRLFHFTHFYPNTKTDRKKKNGYATANEIGCCVCMCVVV